LRIAIAIHYNCTLINSLAINQSTPYSQQERLIVLLYLYQSIPKKEFSHYDL